MLGLGSRDTSDVIQGHAYFVIVPRLRSVGWERRASVQARSVS